MKDISYEEFSPERPSIFTVSVSPTYCSECCHSHFSDEFLSPSADPFLQCTCAPFILTISCQHRIIFVADSIFSILTYPIELQKLIRFVYCLRYFITD